MRPIQYTISLVLLACACGADLDPREGESGTSTQTETETETDSDSDIDNEDDNEPEPEPEPEPVAACEPMALSDCPSISECNPVLEAALGVELTTYENEERMTREMAKSYLCSESNTTYIFRQLQSEQGGGDVSVLFGLFGSSGAGSVLQTESSFRSWQRSSCSEAIERAELEELRQYFMTVDDRRESIYAWTECVTTVSACRAASAPNPKGLIAVVEDPESEALAITLRWCGTVGDVLLTDAQVTGFDTPGLACSRPIEVGDELPVGDTSVLCTRTEREVDGIFSVSVDVQVGSGSPRRYSTVQIIPGLESEPICTEQLFYFDPDGDGYAAADARTMYACAPPEGQADLWTSRAPDVWTDTDCCELDPEARPGQVRFFAERNACGSFDYDCDGDERLQLEATAVCAFEGVEEPGWSARVGVPGCGEVGQFAEKDSWCFRGIIPAATVDRLQQCR